MVQRTSGCTQQVKSRTPLDGRTRPVQVIPEKASVLMRIGLAAQSMWPGLAVVVRTFSLGAGSEGKVSTHPLHVHMHLTVAHIS